MKKILIPLALLHPDTKAPLSFARSTYITKISDLKVIPMFVSAYMSRGIIDEIYDMCDGVLFMGGGDFDAKYYMEENHDKNDRKEPLRDEMELYILSKVLKDKKPFLGICRGEQALAITSGGSLFQHVPDISTKEEHHLRPEQTYDHLFTNDKHIIQIDKDSKAYKLLGVEKLDVNTAHHQAVKTLGPELIISGKTSEGIVEIIEHKDPDYFCYGIQFHAEAMTGITDKFFMGLVDSL